MRENGETVALLYHATGVGKTVTATTDAKAVGGNTLFLVNRLNLADQAEKTFAELWQEATRGYFTGSKKETDKKVIFCASVNHSQEIATTLQEQGVQAESVSGKVPVEERTKILECYEKGEISVLCACDLLNEGWDSPKTEVLFMGRPTMSKTIYM